MAGAAPYSLFPTRPIHSITRRTRLLTYPCVSFSSAATAYCDTSSTTTRSYIRKSRALGGLLRLPRLERLSGEFSRGTTDDTEFTDGIALSVTSETSVVPSWFSPCRARESGC